MAWRVGARGGEAVEEVVEGRRPNAARGNVEVFRDSLPDCVGHLAAAVQRERFAEDALAVRPDVE